MVLWVNFVPIPHSNEQNTYFSAKTGVEPKTSDISGSVSYEPKTATFSNFVS